MDLHNEITTTVFAPEIEDSTVSILWHEPERCGVFYREMDPVVHLMQPALRIIAQAIDLAFRELGTNDFAIVCQVVRELRGFDEVGGLEGLNRIFVIHQYRCSPENTHAIFAEYMRLLKAYALHRKADLPMMPYRFNRGEILLRENKNKRGAAADYLGMGKIAGKIFSATGRKSSEGILVSLFPK